MHEIKNPIGSIKMFMQMAYKRIPDQQFREDYDNTISREFDRIINISNSVANFSKKTTANFSKVNIMEILDNVLRLMQNEFFRKQVQITRKYPENLPEIDADESQLKQVFINLFLNAIDAMKSQKGSITIEINQDKDWIVISIADTGTGIPEDIIHNIFDPFITTKPEGTGLGLSITRKIISNHSGTISVDSEPNKGSVFTIKLPIKSINSN